MNFTAIFTAIFGYIEKNPTLFESLLTSVINLFQAQPALLAKAVAVGVAHAEAALPPTVKPVV